MGIEIPARFKGKEALYEKLINMFIKDLPQEWSSYGDFIADMENAKAFVHKTKGTSGNLDSKEIYEAAVEFEKSLRDGAPQEELYNNFVAACDAVKKSIY
ncbi:MAG: Hpt domain-containing protein [Chitinispirillia bacterium]|nr:Hpt domain-containing protein [Chitinispirillia bacterium]